MAQSPVPPVFPAAMPQEDSLTTFEDVMAFIDGFGATTPDMNADGLHDELTFSSFSSDNSDEDALFERSDELLNLLELTTPSTVVTLSADCPIPVDQSHRVSSASSRASRITVGKRSSSPQCDTKPTTRTATPVKEATRKRNAYREKMKRELQYLRLRAAEMEEQLTALRQGTATLSSEDKQLIDSSWKRIAENQLAALKESEVENARLKGVVRDHMMMSKSLEQSLGKRLDTAFMVEDAKPKAKRGRTQKTWEGEGFADLANDLDASYERLNQVMQESGMADSATDSSRSYQMKTFMSASGLMSPYTELTDIEVTPFHPRLTAKAVWRSVLHQFFQQKRDDYGVEKIWQTGNTFAAKCRTKYTLKSNGGQEMFLNCKVVLRKYIDEESRMVLVWRAHNEGEGDLAGVYADETGWSVVQPISGTFGHSTSGSVVRTCIHVVHRHRETSLVLDPTAASVGMLTDLVMASNEEDMLGITKSVENLLLDEVKAESSRSGL